MKNSRPARERAPESLASSSSTPAAPSIYADRPLRPAYRPGGPPSHDEIARRAYAMWDDGDHAHGHDQEHWFAAERELRDAFGEPWNTRVNRGAHMPAEEVGPTES